MKKTKPLRIILALITINLLISIHLFSKNKTLETKKINPTEGKVVVKTKEETKKVENTKVEIKEEEIYVEKEEIVLEEPKENPIVFDGMTIEQLSEKLNKSLYSTLSGYGSTFARLSLQYNMDPYLVVAISLQETGCKWGCSYLVKNCNNIGGMKGEPSCGGSYRSFETLELGIQKYIENLYYNYYMVGLTTPETMNSKYAESTTWAEYVNEYIEEIKAK